MYEGECGAIKKLIQFRWPPSPPPPLHSSYSGFINQFLMCPRKKNPTPSLGVEDGGGKGPGQNDMIWRRRGEWRGREGAQKNEKSKSDDHSCILGEGGERRAGRLTNPRRHKGAAGRTKYASHFGCKSDFVWYKA